MSSFVSPDVVSFCDVPSLKLRVEFVAYRPLTEEELQLHTRLFLDGFKPRKRPRNKTITLVTSIGARD